MSLAEIRVADKNTNLSAGYYWFRRRIPMLVATCATLFGFLFLQAILPVASLPPAVAWSIVILGAQTGFLGLLAKAGVLAGIAVTTYKLQTAIFKISYFDTLEYKFKARGELIEKLKVRCNKARERKKTERDRLIQQVHQLAEKLSIPQRTAPIEAESLVTESAKLKRSEQEALLPTWYAVFRYKVPFWSAVGVAGIGFLFLNALLPIAMLPPALAWSIVILGAQTGVMGFLAKAAVLGAVAMVAYKVQTGLFKLFAFNMLDNKFQISGSIIKCLIDFAEQEKTRKHTAEREMKKHVEDLNVRVCVLENQLPPVAFSTAPPAGLRAEQKILPTTSLPNSLSASSLEDAGNEVVSPGNAL